MHEHISNCSTMHMFLYMFSKNISKLARREAYFILSSFLIHPTVYMSCDSSSVFWLPKADRLVSRPFQRKYPLEIGDCVTSKCSRFYYHETVDEHL